MARDIFDTDTDEADTAFEVEQDLAETGDDTVVADETTTEAPAEVEAILEKKVGDLTADEKKVRQEHLDAQHLPQVEAFKQVVEAAIETADADTGTVPDGEASKVLAAYREVSGGIKYKNLAKDFVADTMTAKLKAKEYETAVAYNEINELLNNAPAEKTGSPAVKVDPKVAAGQRIAALDLARTVLVEQAEDDEELAGLEIPDTSRDYGQVQEYLGWEANEAEDKGEAPELGPIAASAVKLIKGRGLGGRRASTGTRVSTYVGPRRSVANHIASAFAGVESGTFLTVSQIAGHSSDEYGDDHPSSGAVSARLFPKNGNVGVEGIEPGTNDEQVSGARKL